MDFDQRGGGPEEKATRRAANPHRYSRIPASGSAVIINFSVPLLANWVIAYYSLLIFLHFLLFLFLFLCLVDHPMHAQTRRYQRYQRISGERNRFNNKLKFRETQEFASIGYHFLERCAVLFVFLFAQPQAQHRRTGSQVTTEEQPGNLTAQVDREIKGQLSISWPPLPPRKLSHTHIHTHTHTHPHGSQPEISLGSAAYQPGGTPISRRATHRPHSINQRPPPSRLATENVIFI